MYDLSPNNLLLIAPEDFYYIKKNDFSYYIFLSFVPENSEALNLQSKVLDLGYTEIQLLDSLIETEDNIQKQTMLQLLLLLADKLDTNVSVLRNEKTRLFTKAVSLMERYLTSSLSVEELADMLDISVSNLKRIFSTFCGMGVHEYFMMLKINKAKQLLLSGDTVTHTAKVLRFSSQAYFSATFKRVIGVSAKAFSLGKTGTEDSIKRKPVKKASHKINSSRNLPDYLL